MPRTATKVEQAQSELLLEFEELIRVRERADDAYSAFLSMPDAYNRERIERALSVYANAHANIKFRKAELQAAIKETL